MMANPALARAHARLRKQSARQQKIAQDVVAVLAQQAALRARKDGTP